MKIAFINGKGGVGKSTCSLLFALALDAAGKAVHVIDKDPQGTISASLARINKEHLLVANDADITIIDTPPRLLDYVNEVVGFADKIIVVSGQGAPDLETTMDTLNLIKRENKLSKTKILFNKLKKGTNAESFALSLDLPVEVSSHNFHDLEQIARVHTHGFSALRGKAKETVMNCILEVL